MCDECKCHEHGCGLFSKIHSNLECELEGKEIRIPDDDNLISKKKNYEENPTHENLISLAGAYFFQLRYREALKLYEQAVEIKGDYLSRRKRAIAYLKLLRFEEAYQEFLWCKDHTDDLLDVTYRLGLCKYYMGEYQNAIAYFKECFPLAKENPDMFISTLYWFYLSSLRCDASLEEFKKYRKEYKNNFYTHPGYDLFIRFASGEISSDDAEYEADTLSALQQTCFYYGMSVYYRNEERRSKMYAKLCLSYEDYFGGFAYIACYVDKKRKNNSK